MHFFYLKMTLSAYFNALIYGYDISKITQRLMLLLSEMILFIFFL